VGRRGKMEEEALQSLKTNDDDDDVDECEVVGGGARASRALTQQRGSNPTPPPERKEYKDGPQKFGQEVKRHTAESSTFVAAKGTAWEKP